MRAHGSLDGGHEERGGDSFSAHVAEEHPLLASINGEELALARGYRGRELGTALDEFAQYREASLELLGQLAESAWLRSGQFEGKSVTLRELVTAMAAHVESHLATLTSDLVGNSEEGNRAGPQSSDEAAVRSA